MFDEKDVTHSVSYDEEIKEYTVSSTYHISRRTIYNCSHLDEDTFDFIKNQNIGAIKYRLYGELKKYVYAMIELARHNEDTNILSKVLRIERELDRLL